LKVDVRDFLHPARAALLDSTERAWVGLDVFFFADHASLARFRAAPLRYVRKLSDPVTQERFRPRTTSPKTVFKGRPYYFVSRASLKTFAAYPDSFSKRHGI
jgi:YHS domain-containing protein